MVKKLKMTQIRSVAGMQERKHRRVMTSLGFRKNYRTLYKNDTPAIRGMLNKVQHLVTWETIDETEIPAGRVKTATFTVIAPPAAAPAEPAPGKAGAGKRSGAKRSGGKKK